MNGRQYAPVRAQVRFPLAETLRQAHEIPHTLKGAGDFMYQAALSAFCNRVNAPIRAVSSS